MATYAQHLIDFFQFLEEKGWVQGNPFKIAKKSMQSKTVPPRRKALPVPTSKEVESLIEYALIHRPGYAIFYALCFYYGSRCTEALKTAWADFDIEKESFTLVGLQDPNMKHKRRGNNWFPIDARMKRILRIYAEWRASFVAPSSPDVLTNSGVSPLELKRLDILGELRQDAAKAGITMADKLVTKSGRRFFTTCLIERGLMNGSPEYNLLRGDVLAGRMKEYYYYSPSKIRDAYGKHAP
jgi:integrase